MFEKVDSREPGSLTVMLGVTFEPWDCVGNSKRYIQVVSEMVMKYVEISSGIEINNDMSNQGSIIASPWELVNAAGFDP